VTVSARSSSKAKKAKARGPAAAPDIYVGLLFVAVAALITGISFLVVELGRYQWTLPS
jgi:hypothetical protein